MGTGLQSRKNYKKIGIEDPSPNPEKIIKKRGIEDSSPYPEK